MMSPFPPRYYIVKNKWSYYLSHLTKFSLQFQMILFPQIKLDFFFFAHLNKKPAPEVYKSNDHDHVWSQTLVARLFAAIPNIQEMHNILIIMSPSNMPQQLSIQPTFSSSPCYGSLLNIINF